MHDEHIVLLNSDHSPAGTASKLESHHKRTPLHLAFSLYIFNKRSQVLVTQRAHTKKVWPGVWTNSCCGHPQLEEAMEGAIRRRVKYELGMRVNNITCILPEYKYKTPPFKDVIENEVCPVFFAWSSDTPIPNSAEVDDYKWMSWDQCNKAAYSDSGNIWSWWCKDQLKQLAKNPDIYKLSLGVRIK